MVCAAETRCDERQRILFYMHRPYIILVYPTSLHTSFNANSTCWLIHERGSIAGANAACSCWLMLTLPRPKSSKNNKMLRNPRGSYRAPTVMVTVTGHTCLQSVHPLYPTHCASSTTHTQSTTYTPPSSGTNSPGILSFITFSTRPTP